MYDWAEFRTLHYALAIVEHKGFRAAAEHVHTAQPNLSARVKQFQQASGLHLYRTTKGNRIRLTDTGVAFKPIVRGLFVAQEEAMEALLAIEHGNIQKIRLGVASSIDPTIFQMLCDLHREMLPQCRIQVVQASTIQLQQDITNKDMDAALLTLPLRPSSRMPM